MTSIETSLYIPLQEIVVSRLMALRSTPDEPLSLVIERLIGEPEDIIEIKLTANIKPNGEKSVFSKYKLFILGEIYPVNTYREALITCLNIIVDLDPGILEKVAQMKGHTRRYIARDRNDIHSERSDLNNRCTYEFRPGWFVGTNYSLNDTNRILEGICKASGLEFSKDIKLLT